MVQAIYDRQSKKAKLEKAKVIKQKRQKDPNGYLGPWAGYGQNLVNGDLTT